MGTLSPPILLMLFIGASVLVCVAGVFLARATDALDVAMGWGQAVGGVVLLAIVTNLPEIAITISASLAGNMDVVIGNLLGGIALQTVVLAVIDAFGNRGKVPLATRVASPVVLLEATLVIVMLALVLVGHHLPAQLVWLRMTPIGLLLAGTWIAALLLIRHMRTQKVAKKRVKPPRKQLLRPVSIFIIAAVATLAGGVTLEFTGVALAQHWHMGGAVFGATVLAAATALPELATGLPSARRGEYTLAASDILGGNAFLPVLFLLATLASGHAVLPGAGETDLYLAALGILLTAVFLAGMVVKPPRERAGIGPDAWLLLTIYVVGIGGLFAVGHGT